MGVARDEGGENRCYGQAGLLCSLSRSVSRNQTQISSAKLRVDYRNWMKHFTGPSCWKHRTLEVRSLQPLKQETNELLAMFVTMSKV